jgi:hypothetical protein
MPRTPKDRVFDSVTIIGSVIAAFIGMEKIGGFLYVTQEQMTAYKTQEQEIHSAFNARLIANETKVADFLQLSYTDPDTPARTAQLYRRRNGK